MQTQTLTLSPDYFNTFYSYFEIIDPKPKKISFVKWIANRISTHSINKTQEMIDQLDVLEELLLTKKVSHKDLAPFKDNIEKLVDLLETFKEFMNDYELDDPIAIKLQDNMFTILDKITVMEKILEQYTDITQAKIDIIEGKTLTLDQAFDV